MNNVSTGRERERTGYTTHYNQEKIVFDGISWLQDEYTVSIVRVRGLVDSCTIKLDCCEMSDEMSRLKDGRTATVSIKGRMRELIDSCIRNLECYEMSDAISWLKDECPACL